MSSLLNASVSRSNIHEFQDPEIQDIPCNHTPEGSFFWQRLREGGTQPNEYFRVEAYSNSHCGEGGESRRPAKRAPESVPPPATPLMPEATPQPLEVPPSAHEPTQSRHSSFEDMQKRRMKWVYKYNI